MGWRQLVGHTAIWLVAGHVTCGAIFAQQSGGVTKTTNGALAVIVAPQLDPLRQYLPRAELFMQVPGGKIAIDEIDLPGLSTDRRAQVAASWRSGDRLSNYELLMEATILRTRFSLNHSKTYAKVSPFNP